MSYRNNISFILTVGFLFLIGALFFSVSAQDETDTETSIDSALFSEGETTFVELHLSPEGIYGVDSGGTEWEYDFSRERFVNEEIDNDHYSTTTVFRRDGIRINIDDLDKFEKLADLENLDALEAEEIVRMAEEAARLAEQAMVKRYKGLQLRSVTVEVDEVVHGSIIAIGEVTVRGVVEGDVISYDQVTISSTGLIEGDVRAPEIVKMRGGTILGERYETELPDIDIPSIVLFEKTSFTAFWVILIIFFSLLFFGLIGIGVALKPINRVKLCLEQQFIKSFFVGLAGWFALGPLMGILVLTIIGIPVAVLVLPLALFLGIILGILAVCQLTGQLSGRYLGMGKGTLIKQIIPGLVILYLPWIMMSLFMISSSGVAKGVSVLFMVIAIVIWSVVVSAGIGAVVLTRFGTREYKKAGPGEVGIKVEIHPSPKPPTPPPLSPGNGQ